MIRSFKLMREAVLDDCRQGRDADMIKRVNAFLNQEYFLLSSKIYVPQQEETYTFNTVSGTRTYSLPIDFNGVIGFQMTDKASDTAFAKNISSKTIQGFIQDYPKGVSDDNREPSVYRIASVNGVKARAQAASEAVTVASSSALDAAIQATCVAYSNATRDAVVHGAIQFAPTGAYTANTYVTMVDEGAVALSVYEMIQIGKSDYSAGTLTFLKGTTTIGTLAPWQLQPEYSTLEFNDTPDAVYGFRMQYKRKPIGMINDGDVPVGFPAEFCEVIEWGAKVRARDYVDDETRVKTAKSLYDEKVAELLMNHAPAEVESFGLSWA